MKAMKLVLGVVVMCLLSMGALAQSSSYRKLLEQAFSTSGTYTWAQTADYPAMMSVDMTFRASTNVNTFTMWYMRGNVKHDLLTVTSATMHTMTWYVPSELYFKTGDIIGWRNTSPASAVISISVKSNY